MGDIEMDSTKRHTYSKTTDSFGHIRAQLIDGMHRYALCEPTQRKNLCVLSAMGCLGLLLGIFCFFFFDVQADVQAFSVDYFSKRAFLSYPTLRDYCVFLSAWFWHCAKILFCALLCTCTVYPFIFCAGLCILRGAMASFAICMFAQQYHAAVILYILVQSALTAILVMFCVKCIRYADKRRALPPNQYRQFSLPWLLSETAPLLMGLLFACSALLFGMLALSAVSCFLLPVVS